MSGGARRVAGRSRPPRRTRARRQRERDEAQEIEQRERQVDPPRRSVDETGPDVGEPVLPDGRAAEAVEARRAEQHRDHRERAGHAIRARQTGDRPADDDPIVPRVEWRDASEQPERDRKALATARPLLAAVDGHACERPVRVERDRDPEHPRIRRPRMRELERDEGEQGDGSRVSAELAPDSRTAAALAARSARAATRTRLRWPATATTPARRRRGRPRAAGGPTRRSRG